MADRKAALGCQLSVRVMWQIFVDIRLCYDILFLIFAWTHLTTELGAVWTSGMSEAGNGDDATCQTSKSNSF